jgi:hypothetical protein
MFAYVWLEMNDLFLYDMLFFHFLSTINALIHSPYDCRRHTSHEISDNYRYIGLEEKRAWSDRRADATWIKHLWYVLWIRGGSSVWLSVC